MSTPQQRDAIARRWGLPRTRAEQARYRAFIDAQMNRDLLRGQLLEANLLLDEARKALDEGSTVHSVSMAPRSEGDVRLQALSLMVRVSRATRDFFAEHETTLPVDEPSTSLSHRLRATVNWLRGRGFNL